MAESNFVDYVKILCRSGKGGRGSMHLKHLKYNYNGGPSYDELVAQELPVQRHTFSLIFSVEM